MSISKDKYLFYCACFDRELYRRLLIIMNENALDYRVENKENSRHARAPLSGYFEAEIYIGKTDYDRADHLLKDLIEEES